ncbi:unnamed protein product [Clavelina lepadiformis]|uniref:Uncharacterized protein n=1 Tax=Clavelina lepadiformis TaxID=159417 RepID=A0ABP0GGN7_CLALP
MMGNYLLLVCLFFMRREGFVLPTSRMVADTYSLTLRQSWRKENTTELPSSNLTPDEISILEYVGGYILRKLKRNGDEEELAILAKLEDSINCFVPSDNSLISILQCNEFGTLLKPNQTLLDVLKFLEINFRNHATLKDTISNAISSLDLSELHDITNNYDLDAYVLQRVLVTFFSKFDRLKRRRD